MLSLWVSAPKFSPLCGKIVLGPQFQCPESIGPERWREEVSRAWNQVTRHAAARMPFDDPQIPLQQKWDLLQGMLQETFRIAFRSVQPDKRFSKAALSSKGAVKQVIPVSQPCHGPAVHLGH